MVRWLLRGAVVRVEGQMSERRVVVDNFAFCVAGCVAIVLSVNIAWELLFFDVKSSFLRKRITR